jgi:hypothetical protein
MLNPEDFRRQLEEALAAKQRADQETAAAQTLRQQQAAVDLQGKATRQATESVVEVGRRNQAVLELDAQLPIQQYLKALRDQLAPKQRVNKFGPENGVIAFSIEYNKKLRYEIINETNHHGYRQTKDILGIVLDGGGVLFIWNKRYVKNANNSESIDTTNPILWQPFFDEKVEHTALGRIKLVQMERALVRIQREEDEKKWLKNPTRENRPFWRPMPEVNVSDYIAADPSGEETYIRKTGITRGDLREVVKIGGINSPEGLQQFAQALTEFYVGLKTGQGK